MSITKLSRLVRNAEHWSRIHVVGSGYNENDPYSGRDPRFYATINYNNALWASRNIEIWQGGKDAPPIQNATKTGYYLKNT